MDLEAVAATQQELASPHWLLSAALHVSFNACDYGEYPGACGATEPNYKAAKRGAVLGGILLGIIALVINGPVHECR